MAFGLNWITTAAPATTDGDHDYWNDSKVWSGDTIDATTDGDLDNLSEFEADVTPGLSMTVRTDISRDELELLVTLREYNTAIDASAEADAARDEAEDMAADARWEKNDARQNFTAALEAVKHVGHYGH
jgi:hypothetical protein